MVLGSDARQEFKACIRVFNGVNFWCTQTSASLNNPIILQNKENMPENEMQHGILPDCKQSSSSIRPQLTSNKRAAYLQSLKDVTINKEKKRKKMGVLSDRGITLFFTFKHICLATLSSQLSQVNFKCNTSDRNQ